MKRLIAVAALLAGGGAALFALQPRPDHSCLREAGRMAGVLPIPRGVRADCEVARAWRANAAKAQMAEVFFGPEGLDAIKTWGDLVTQLEQQGWQFLESASDGGRYTRSQWRRGAERLWLEVVMPDGKPSQFVIATE